MIKYKKLLSTGKPREEAQEKKIVIFIQNVNWQLSVPRYKVQSGRSVLVSNQVCAFVLCYNKNLSNSPANVICDCSTSMGTWTVQMVSFLFCLDFLFRHFLCTF